MFNPYRPLVGNIPYLPQVLQLRQYYHGERRARAVCIVYLCFSNDYLPLESLAGLGSVNMFTLGINFIRYCWQSKKEQYV